MLKGKNCFAGHKGIVLAHDVPPLGMPGQHPACTSVKQHGGRSFARKGPFLSRIAILCARRKRRNALKGVRHAVYGRKGCKNNHILPRRHMPEAFSQIAGALGSLSAGFIHLPVGGKYFLHDVLKDQMEQR